MKITSLQFNPTPVVPDPEKSYAAESAAKVIAPLAGLTSHYCSACRGLGILFHMELHNGQTFVAESSCQTCSGTGDMDKIKCGRGKMCYHAWVHPNPVDSICVNCNASAVTVKTPDPLSLL